MTDEVRHLLNGTGIFAVCNAEEQAQNNQDGAYAIALRPRLVCDDEIITWDDGNRDRRFSLVAITEHQGVLCISTEDSGTWRLVPLTISLFDKELRPKLIDFPEFESDKALCQFYLERY